MTIARFIVATLVAPLATLMLPILLAFSEFYVEHGVVPLDHVDDAGMRSAGLFIFIGAPICYMLAAAFYSIAGHILVCSKKVGLLCWLVISAAAPWGLVLVAAIGVVQNNHNHSTGLLVIGVLGILSSTFASIGAIVWWVIAAPSEGA